jgi:predicted nucleic acid-binding Zn ribbon protein
MRSTLDRPRRARGRTTDTTRRELVARYHRSDLTQRAFCEQVGLPLSTLQWWLVKGRREAASVAPVTFTEVSLPVETQVHRAVCADWAVEIVTHTGVTLRFREPLAPALLRFVSPRARC